MDTKEIYYNLSIGGVPMGQKKQYDKEYKTEVAKLVIESGRSAASVANKHQEAAFPGKGKLKPHDQQVRELKKKIADLEEENAILKKAAAILVKSPK